jgi:predicted secreted acid phosphatase
MTRRGRMLRLPSAALLLALLSLGACAGSPTPAAPGEAVPTVAAETTSDLPNLGILREKLLRYQASGEYELQLAATATEAARYLASRPADGGRGAIVLDLDETSLSNWTYLEANQLARLHYGPCDLPQGPCGWTAWADMAAASAIEPTLEVYRLAQNRGLAVFFITGRPESERAATERNLRAVGYEGWANLYMEPDGAAFPSAADFKAPRRHEIEEQGYEIVLNMGDQDSDLEGGYARRTFKLPNPFYWIP